MSTHSQKAAKELDTLKTTAGLTLLDIVPVAFPEHVLMKRLKDERDLLARALLQRFWRDNGPWALWRDLDLFNRKLTRCRCNVCSGSFDLPISVEAWDKFRWFLTESGLTHVVISEEREEDFNQCAVQGPCKMVFEGGPGQEYKDAYPVPPGFNPLTACTYMTPVSHIDLHIVIQTYENRVGLTYGRRLWECADTSSSRELRKLDLLYASLRTPRSGL